MKLIPRSPAYRRAQTEADLARSSFLLALNRTRQRLHPAVIKQDLERKISEAAHDTRQAAVHTARSHPFITGGALAIVLGLVFRKPLAAFTRKARASLSKASRTGSNSGDNL